MSVEAGQGLPEGAAEWDEAEWLSFFDQTELGQRSTCFIFDFASPPRARGDSSGSADGLGLLQIVVELPCTVCFRPTVVIYRRRNGENAKVRDAAIEARMQEIDWHALHPQRKRKSAEAAPA